MRNGILNARGDILIFSDADLSSPIYESIKPIGAIDQGADVAFGSPWLLAETQTKRQSLLRQFVGRAHNLLLRLVLGLPYKDTQCGLFYELLTICIFRLLRQHDHPKFQFLASTPEAVLAEDKHPA